ncbi:MAG: hypothetical protein AABX04_05285 [Nanoarchaeota archaeon]
MVRKIYEVEYNDGSTVALDLSLVWQYTLGTSPVNPGVNFSGTGCSEDYLAKSLQENKPIIVSKTAGTRDIETIINTNNVRCIKAKE